MGINVCMYQNLNHDFQHNPRVGPTYRRSNGVWQGSAPWTITSTCSSLKLCSFINPTYNPTHPGTCNTRSWWSFLRMLCFDLLDKKCHIPWRDRTLQTCCCTNIACHSGPLRICKAGTKMALESNILEMKLNQRYEPNNWLTTDQWKIK